MDVEEAPLGLSLGILSLSGAARRGRIKRYGRAVYTARQSDIGYRLSAALPWSLSTHLQKWIRCLRSWLVRRRANRCRIAMRTRLRSLDWHDHPRDIPWIEHRDMQIPSFATC